jgi:hypothetical protein
MGFVCPDLVHAARLDEAAEAKQGKGREAKGREAKARLGKGREGKMT